MLDQLRLAAPSAILMSALVSGSALSSSKMPPLNHSIALEADLAALLGHRREQRLGIVGEALRLVQARLQHALEELVGQQVHVLREHAEHHAVDEVRHLLRVVAALAQVLRQLDELLRHLLGQRLARLAGLELLDLGLGERLLEDLAPARVGQLRQRERVHLLDRVGPVGVQLDPLHVGDDQQRRVLQRAHVVLQLLERRVRGPCRGSCTPRRSSRASTRRPSRRRRRSSWRPSRRRTTRPWGRRRWAPSRPAGCTGR